MSTDLGETEEGAVLAAAVTGDKNPVPNKNTYIDCKSCGAKIAQIYCGNCGQKNDDLRRSLWRLIGESLGGIFSFESRMWRTWGALLFKPGKVAYEYANGARTRYSPPIRVYLVVSFLFFGFLAASQTNLFALSVQPKATGTPTVAEPNQTQTPEMIDNEEALFNGYSFKPLFFQSQDTFEKLLDEKATDEFLQTIQGNSDGKEESLEETPQEDQLKAIRVFLKNPIQFNASFKRLFKILCQRRHLDVQYFI